MKRLFIGIPVLSSKAEEMVRSWQNDQALNLNRLAWTRNSNWHFTLVFLGATQQTAITALCQVIDKAFDHCSSYTSELKGVGVFPNSRRPNVLWLGIDDIQPLLPSYQKLVDLLATHHFTVDPKPLKPHLTIARIKNLHYREPFDNLVNAHQHDVFGQVFINSIILYESVSTPDGVMYQPLYEKRLEETF